MIIDIPPIRHATIKVDDFTHKIIVTRRFFIRLIWSETQKSILFGRWTIDFRKTPSTPCPGI
jgi:hypothetical protein